MPDMAWTGATGDESHAAPTSHGNPARRASGHHRAASVRAPATAASAPPKANRIPKTFQAMIVRHPNRSNAAEITTARNEV